MNDRLFDIEDIPEAPLFRPPRRSRGEGDARFRNEYPPEWHQCMTCNGNGSVPDGEQRGLAVNTPWKVCPDCRGSGSVKARVRLDTGHRCVRCKHPYVPKGDALRLGLSPSWRDEGWSACDVQCEHAGYLRVTGDGGPYFGEYSLSRVELIEAGCTVEAQWRVLTVHHLDGDKANCRWWNLAALCQRCHLEIQAKVVMERIYPHEHSEWFKPYVAGYYAWVYLGEELTREETILRLDELLGLELATT